MAASLKISELNALTAMADDDLFLVTDTSATTSKKVTFSTLKSNIAAAANTVIGVSSGAAHLGTFSGTTIADSQTIKQALQSLETRLEAVDIDTDDMATLVGLAENVANLGTFTGSTISDNDSIKDALQSLETAAELRSTIDNPTFTTKISSPEFHAAGSHLKFKTSTNDIIFYPNNTETLQITRHSGTGHPTFTANGGSGEFKFNQLVETAGGLKLDGVSLTTVQIASESFADNDTSLMTSAAINDLIGANSSNTLADLGVTATAAEVNVVDGVTAGTVIASKAIVTDGNNDIIGGRNITISGELDASIGDFSGDVDIAGTTNLDAVDIDGAVQIDGTLNVGVNGTGYDVKLYGDTSGAQMLWDASVDDLQLLGTAGLEIPNNGRFVLGSNVSTSIDCSLQMKNDFIFSGGARNIKFDNNRYNACRFMSNTGDIFMGMDTQGDNTIFFSQPLDINTSVQADGTFTVGVDDTGYDVKFHGATASAYMLWDESADDLILAGDAGLVVPEGQFTLGSTAVTSTAAELNFVDGVTSNVQTQLDAKAALAGPTFTGTPAAPTASAGTNTTQLATTAFVATAVANTIDSAPGALDTLNELAAALNDDASFSTTVTNLINANETHIDNVVTLSGVAKDATNLGTFTGSTISDNGTLKAGIQELETAVETKQATDAELTELATMASATAAALADLTEAEVQILDGATVTTAELNILDGVTSTAAELNLVDGITAGTVSASLAVIADSNKDVTGFRNVTATGELDAATLDISGTSAFADNVVIENGKEIRLSEASGNGTNYTGFKAPAALTANVSFTLPDGDGTNGQVITTNGSAVLAWSDAPTPSEFSGVTAGTVAASKGVEVDSNKDITGFRNVTLTGELDAATGDFSGDVDIAGTTNLDAVDIDGNVDLAANLTFSGGARDILLTDNTADALEILEGSNQYMSFSTTDSGEKIEVFKDVYLTGERLYFDAGSQLIRLKDNQASALKIENGDGSTQDFLEFVTENTGESLKFGAPNQFNNTVTVGVDDTGYDVKFFGSTSGASLLWDESADDLILAGAAGLIVPDGQLALGSTAVTSTATELNLLDGVTATTAELNYVDGVTSAIQTQIDTKAAIAGPTFTGTPAAPTASAGTNTTQLATTAFVQTAVAATIDGAPGALDTLNELAAALGDDANFSTTVTNLITANETHIDNVATLSGVAKDSTHLATFTGSTISDNQTVKAAIQALETAVETKQATDAELTELATMASTTAAALADLLEAEVQILDGATVTTDELNILDGVTSTAAELNLVDGITAGTIAASKAVIVDSNKDITGFRNVTLTGELDAATGDFSGDIDVAGTTNLDAVDIDGDTDLAGDLTFSAAKDIQIIDNNAAALEIAEAGNNYMVFDTRDGAEKITLSKATTFASNVTFEGDLTISGQHDISMDDNTAAAIDFKQGSNSYLKFDTTDGSELITFSERLKLAGNAVLITFDNDAQFNVPDNSADALDIMYGSSIALRLETTDDAEKFIFYENILIDTGKTFGFDDHGSAQVDRIQGTGTSFADNDTSLMTSAAIQDKVQALVPTANGTFTAQLEGSTGNPGSKITSTAHYARSGDLVQATIYFNNVDTSSYSGAISISGLPIQAKDTAGGMFMGTVHNVSMISGANDSVTAIVSDNGTTIVFVENNSTTALNWGTVGTGKTMRVQVQYIAA